MSISFPYKKEPSRIFGFIRRPVARVKVWSFKTRGWVDVLMVVDTGADYTLFPAYQALNFGIDLERDCKSFSTFGVGGGETVHFYKKKARIKVGDWERRIPIGFLSRDDIPPLLGRKGCLDTFDVLFSRFKIIFSSPKPR